MYKSLTAAIVLSTFAFAGNADAAAISKSLQTAAQKSFQGLQSSLGKNNYLKGDRVKVLSSNGKTASVAIQAFGRQPGPIMPGTRPSVWYNTKMATFKKTSSGTWAKSGRWNQLMFALDAGK
jgi:hypothetical protein